MHVRSHCFVFCKRFICLVPGDSFRRQFPELFAHSLCPCFVVFGWRCCVGSMFWKPVVWWLKLGLFLSTFLVRSRNKSYELSDCGEHVVSWLSNLLATSPSYDEAERRPLHLLKCAAAIQNMPLKQRHDNHIPAKVVYRRVGVKTRNRFSPTQIVFDHHGDHC